MTIHLISFASLLHKQATLRSSHEAILSELEKYYTVKLVDYQDMDKLTSDDFKIIFIATGGVERLVIQHFERLPRPAILLADGMQNSLAAALEISTWLRGRGMKSEILHGELPAIIQRVHILYIIFGHNVLYSANASELSEHLHPGWSPAMLTIYWQNAVGVSNT